MLEELTKEQLDLIPIYRDRWIKIGLGTGETDKKRVRDIIPRVYKIGKLNSPKLIVYCDSPLACLISSSIPQPKNPVQNQVWNQAAPQIWHQVQVQVQNQVRNQVPQQVQTQVWDQVVQQVQIQVQNQVRNQVLHQVQNQLID